VSAGTNFLLLNDTAVRDGTSSRFLDNFTSQLIESFGSDEARAGPMSGRMRQKSSRVLHDFLFSTVWDKETQSNVYQSEGFDAVRIRSGSPSDQRPGDLYNPDTGETFTTDRLFALNNFNFAFANKFLIPRAVGVLAGMNQLLLPRQDRSGARSGQSGAVSHPEPRQRADERDVRNSITMP